jgi:pyruvate dehydrogenase phosphatase
VGGFLYYFVDVEDEEDWQHGCFNSYQEDQSHGTPLHFYRDKDDLDHYLQFHVLDPSASLKDPGVAQFLSEQFEKLAYGWMMTEEVLRSMVFASLPKTDKSSGCAER